MSFAPALTDEYVFLTGRPPISEFVGFVKAMAVNGHQLDQAPLVAEWRAGNDRVLELERAEAGWADEPKTGDLPAGMARLAEAALAMPEVEKTFGLFPRRWAMVELDRLVVYQKFINMRYVRELLGALECPLDDEKLMRFSLGNGLDRPEVRVSPMGPGGYAFTSPSDDLRFLDFTLLSPPQITDYIVQGVPAICIGAAVGYSVNFITALEIGGRLILHNGSHRAFALREAGARHAPCLIQRVSRVDELELVGVPDLMTNSDRYLKAPRPAVLKDYFDPPMRKAFQVTRKHRLVQVQVSWQAGKTPVT